MIDQDRTPLLDALQHFKKENTAFFRIPAHRFAVGVDERALEVIGDRAYEADLTEAEGLDDLHHPEGAIAEAQELAADLYGSDRCWFLINGTTCGNEAMLLACLQPGEKVLVARNAHKSVLMGLILSGAVPVWMEPEFSEEFGVYGAVTPETVYRYLLYDEAKEIKAVFLVSPTYYGQCSELTKIADICHDFNVPLLVDEAHGAHMYFHDDFPEGAVAAGADLVAQSTHKTAGSMTQSSMLHLQGNLVSADRVDECLKLVMSTSPNYVLMGSLDGARHRLAMRGRQDMIEALRLAEMARDGLKKIPGVRVLSDKRSENNQTAERNLQDPLRIVFHFSDFSVTGYRLQELLYEEDRISLELSDHKNVVLVITWANTEADIQRLLKAVACVRADLEKNSHKYKQSERHKISRSDFREGHFTSEFSGAGSLPIPKTELSPREAFYGTKQSVPLDACVGEVAAESVIPYPPGIPILCPGERITEDVIRLIEQMKADGVSFHGPRDEKLEQIDCIKLAR